MNLGTHCNTVSLPLVCQFCFQFHFLGNNLGKCDIFVMCSISIQGVSLYLKLFLTIYLFPSLLLFSSEGTATLSLS